MPYDTRIRPSRPSKKFIARKTAGRLLAVLLASCGLILASCNGSSPSDAPDTNDESSAISLLPKNVQDAINGDKSTMTQELKNSLAFMGNEERLAYDLYNALHKQFPSLNVLNNIARNSEYRHIAAVQLLVRKYIYDENDFTNVDLSPLGYKDVGIPDMQPGIYDIKAIQSLYDTLYAKGLNSERDALEVGCMVEVTDVNDLNEKIEMAQNSDAEDIETVFNFLREGSYRHYWAFDQALKGRGITGGCCSLGNINGVNYCHNEYPK